MKKQIFTPHHQQQFQKHFGIKKNPGKWNILYRKKTEKYMGLISWIPGIRMIGIGNSLSMNSGSKKSDIDLYIVTDNHSMWTVRILVTCIFQIFGVRKTGKKHAGRFCLSFFSTLEGMDFSRFALTHDPYLFFWILYFQPIYNSHQTYEKFLEVNNRWCNLEDFVVYPGIEGYPQGATLRDDVCRSSPCGSPSGGKNINSLLKNIFLPKTKKSFQKLGKPFGVIISDDVLKFHDHDIRKKIADIIQ